MISDILYFQLFTAKFLPVLAQHFFHCKHIDNNNEHIPDNSDHLFIRNTQEKQSNNIFFNV